jgi:hypothetical protein
MISTKKIYLLLLAFTVSIASHAQSGTGHAALGKQKPIDIQKLEQALQMKGIEQNGEYKITVPQNDLNIDVDGFKIIPPMGLGSWIHYSYIFGHKLAIDISTFPLVII